MVREIAHIASPTGCRCQTVRKEMMQMAEPKLRLCPFCGETPRMVHSPFSRAGTERDVYYVLCDCCGSQSDERCTEDGAALIWNQRIADRRLPIMVEQLRAHIIKSDLTATEKRYLEDLVWRKHSDWVSDGDGYHCRRCGIWKRLINTLNYCPNCGAKMLFPENARATGEDQGNTAQGAMKSAT